MTTHYQYPMFARLEPRTPRFTGGRITETDRLTLDEAATFASKHAGTEITPADFLRAAARGEITLRAIIHREAKLEKHDGGIYCNEGALTENTVPKGALATLPLSACEQLESVGHASWRTFDGFDYIDDEWLRFTVAALLDNEPDFETVPTDCRVLGDAVHALADEYIDTPAATSGAQEKAAPPAPVVADACTTGMVAWQAAILENVESIVSKYGKHPNTWNAISWCKTHGPRDVFPKEQPGERGLLTWLDLGGVSQTVKKGTVDNVLTLWRKAGKFPAVK